MKRWWMILLLPMCMAQEECDNSARNAERAVVQSQQSLYQSAQPIPTFDFSLERDRIIGLYRARQTAAQTFSVWRSNTGRIEGHCPSSGYPLPYGVQLTANLSRSGSGATLLALPQAEPNGLFSDGISTAGTWVFCVVDGQIAPLYIESEVTVYPYPIDVDYDTDRVTPAGKPTVSLNK